MNEYEMMLLWRILTAYGLYPEGRRNDGESFESKEADDWFVTVWNTDFSFVMDVEDGTTEVTYHYGTVGNPMERGIGMFASPEEAVRHVAWLYKREEHYNRHLDERPEE